MDKRPEQKQSYPLPSLMAGEIIPAPHPSLAISIIKLPAGSLLHRIHLARYQAEQFNPGMRGNARFSPISNNQGVAIPTLYGGATQACALMETIFHDVPFSPGLKTLDKQKLLDQVYSVLQVQTELQLIDLSNVALRRLGISRKQIIDTEKEHYPVTREWAQALHQQHPSAQGLSWISRQDDSARAVMLFGDRIPSKTFMPTSESASLLRDADVYNSVLDLAVKIGVLIVSAK